MKESGNQRKKKKKLERIKKIDIGREEIKKEIGCGDDRYDDDESVDKKLVEGEFGGERENDEGKRNECDRKKGKRIEGKEE